MNLNEIHSANKVFDGLVDDLHMTYEGNMLTSVRDNATRLPYSGATDYLLGGSLTLRNGRIDKLQFEEGYCQASAYSGNATQDDFSFHYYDRDHLGNIRQVVRADRTTNGTLVQTMDYYPFGAQFCHSSTASEVQSRKYNFSIEREKRKLACSSEREKNRPKVNGKEFDKMHGLDTYDYGARQYDPVLGRWDRMDPLCEKYYDVSPYAYCENNPIRFFDPNGKEKLSFLSTNERKESDFSVYDYNTTGVINIWMHGIYENRNALSANSMQIRVGRNNWKEVSNADDIEQMFLKKSHEWKNNGKGNVIIVLHACGADDFAKKMSNSSNFMGRGITFIAPNNNIHVNKDTITGKVRSYINNYPNENKKIRREGKWTAYRDGKVVATYGSMEKPGSKNFNYKFKKDEKGN